MLTPYCLHYRRQPTVVSLCVESSPECASGVTLVTYLLLFLTILLYFGLTTLHLYRESIIIELPSNKGTRQTTLVKLVLLFILLNILANLLPLACTYLSEAIIHRHLEPGTYLDMLDRFSPRILSYWQPDELLHFITLLSVIVPRVQLLLTVIACLLFTPLLWHRPLEKAFIDGQSAQH